MSSKNQNQALPYQSQKQDPEYLTTPQAAAFLNVSTQWLEISRHKGDGPPYIKLARMVRYSKSDLQQYMESCRRTNTIGGAQ